MSLISDPDYLIHNLRLTYLRHVDDPYAPRILSLNPRYSSIPHVLAAGLADDDRWPELAMPSSPVPTDDERTTSSSSRRRHSGFPGATGLKYTQTIMGPSRTGAVGMRVSGKRASTMKQESPLPPLPFDAHAKRLRSDSEPTPNVPSSLAQPAVPAETLDDSFIQVSKRRSAGGTSLADVPASLVDATDLAQQMPAQFIPNFARGSEMEARRRHRLRARFDPSKTALSPDQSINPDDSSADEDDLADSMPEDEDEFDDLAETEETDDFDPDFAPPQIGVTSESASEGASVSMSIANSALSTSLSTSLRTRNRLSPVKEGRANDEPPPRTTTEKLAPATIESFEMLTPAAPSRPPRTRTAPTPDAPATTPDLSFARRKVAPARAGPSALSSALAASSSASSNPFSELYALISGRAEVASMGVTVFFPHARAPIGKALQLNVRKDASVEEVIGFALWSYWEEGWQPKLDQGLPDDEEDPKRKARLSAAGWVLRIAEDDGEVDEDFPAPDRMGKISKFNFEAYAVLEANASQIAQNQQLESKIARRPSRIIVAKKRTPEPAAGLLPPAGLGPGTSAISSSALGTSVSGLSTSLGLSSSHGPQILLRVRVADVADTAVHYSTTISVYAGMYMQESLELVCRKRKLTNPKEWALLVSDPKVLIPLDRTVASLQGKSDLILVKRSSLPQLGINIDGDRRAPRTTDPNASIFKRMSEVPEVKFSAEMDITAAYKKFTVFRKLPMLVTRLERTLAIDGEYVHIMPSANKARAVFDSMKTASYHIKSVIGCTQSAKSSSSFKFIVRRDGGDKRYDFEAESPKMANEIVSCIRNMKSGVERSGTVNKLRRSRQVV